MDDVDDDGFRRILSRQPARRRKRGQGGCRRRTPTGGGEVVHVHAPLAEGVAERPVADVDASVLGVDIAAADSCR